MKALLLSLTVACFSLQTNAQETDPERSTGPAKLSGNGTAYSRGNGLLLIDNACFKLLRSREAPFVFTLLLSRFSISLTEQAVGETHFERLHSLVR